MRRLTERLNDLGLKIINEEILDGLHAGSITRLSVVDKNNQTRKVIYKECSSDRNNEIDIYKARFSFIQSFTPVISVWEDEPEAFLMNDLGEPLKASFNDLTDSNKKSLLMNILMRLRDLHTNKIGMKAFPKHKLTTEWLTWCLQQLKGLKDLQLGWFKNEWLILVEKAQKVITADYVVKSPHVLTHGDPHLDNVFQDHNGSILFIDWEWAAHGSPLRDLTILLQDIYDENLIAFVKEKYYELLTEKDFNLDKSLYIADFHYLYLDHTLMMLAWEIEKFSQGYHTEKNIQEIINFKVDQLQKTLNQMSFSHDKS